ncbi:MAG: hypothetical protein K2O78_05725 [Muribaculaceae bacterium]|nr:hypothetical protein [Muribaculaceae bacterium]
MKKPGSTCDYTKVRNAELAATFNRRLAEARTIDLLEICRLTSESAASRFFISEERAYELVMARRRLGHWPIRLRHRIRMMEEISSRAEALLASGMESTLRDAVYAAVNSPAPEFYLTPRSCRTLVYATFRAAYLDATARRAAAVTASTPDTDLCHE